MYFYNLPMRPPAVYVLPEASGTGHDLNKFLNSVGSPPSATLVTLVLFEYPFFLQKP